jgi:hypothetical protein
LKKYQDEKGLAKAALLNSKKDLENSKRLVKMT